MTLLRIGLPHREYPSIPPSVSPWIEAVSSFSFFFHEPTEMTPRSETLNTEKLLLSR